MTLNRRDLLVSSGAAAAIGLLPACTTLNRAATPTTDAEVQRLLAEIAEDIMSDYPESATSLGLDKDNQGGLKTRLTDRSPLGQRRLAARALARLARLQAVDETSLSSQTITDLGVVRTAHELAVDGFRFPYGDVIILNQEWSYRNSPYAVAHNMGAFVDLPDFLQSKHAISTPEDAEAYLARLEAYATALDGETARLRHDADLGVIAPAFSLDKTLRQQRAARAIPAPEWSLVTSIEQQASSFGSDYGRRATQIVTEKIIPALDRQIAELARQRTIATHDAGVWKLPDGDAYYAWALRAATTSNLTPNEVHRLGIEQLKDLHSQMDALLRAQGLTTGSVGQRIRVLGQNPKYLFPNTDEGRAQILAYINGLIDEMRTLIPRAFATFVPARLVVKRVPPEIEAGAPGAYAAAGAIDGSMPGSYYINLHDTSRWPRFALDTLTYHEAIPGHVWQGEYTHKLPLVRSLLAFNAYSEGWALYAETIADELGVYEDDPVGRLGYLQAIAFRAARLVVDTGIHTKRWTREQAIQWFAEAVGSPEAEVTSEIDRYCVWPGQACGYKIGQTEILRLREKARAALGNRFDVRLFNDAVVKAGGVPLTVLEDVINRHIAERRA